MISALDIEKLLYEGETLHSEFKSDKRHPLSDQDIYEDIVAFANAEGGRYLIGVENNGDVTGARHRHEKCTDPLKLKTAIFNNTVPSISTQVDVVNMRGCEIVVITIPPYGHGDIYATRSGKCVKRVIGSNGQPENIPYYPCDHRSKKTDLASLDFSAQRIDDALFNDLDLVEFERLKKTIISLHGDASLLELSNEELAKAMRLVESSRGVLVPNVAGLLLLGTENALERHMPTHQIFFQVIDQKGEVKKNESLKGGLLHVIDAIESFFKAYNQEREVDIGLFRLPVPDYAPQGFREAINNALLHRDYSRLDAIYIQWHWDHLLISSPGGFPLGVTVDNLLVHEPKPRNPRLAEAFKRVGIIEQTGRGVDRIFMGQLRYGRPVPDYSRSDSTGVRVVLHGGEASLDFAKVLFEYEKSKGPLTLDELIIMNVLFRERRIDSGRAASLMQKGVSDARAALEKLTESGLLEGRGERKGRVFHLASWIYDTFDKRIGYIRSKGVGAIRHEALVMEYVENQGRIERKHVMELLGVNGIQANRILNRLCVSGKLVMKGSRPRWVYYTKS